MFFSRYCYWCLTVVLMMHQFQSHDECSRRINGLTNGFKLGSLYLGKNIISRRIIKLCNLYHRKVLRSFGRGYRVFFIIMDDKGCDLVHRNTTLGLQKVLKGNVQVEQSVGVPFSMVAVQAQQRSFSLTRDSVKYNWIYSSVGGGGEWFFLNTRTRIQASRERGDSDYLFPSLMLSFLSGLEVSLYLAVMFLPKIMRWRFRRLRVEYKVLLIAKRRSHDVLSSIYIGSQRMDRSFEEVQLDGQVVVTGFLIFKALISSLRILVYFVFEFCWLSSLLSLCSGPLDAILRWNRLGLFGFYYRLSFTLKKVTFIWFSFIEMGPWKELIIT